MRLPLAVLSAGAAGVLLWAACGADAEAPPLTGNIAFYSYMLEGDDSEGEALYQPYVMNADGSQIEAYTGLAYEEVRDPYTNGARIYSTDRSRYAYISWTFETRPDYNGVPVGVPKEGSLRVASADGSNDHVLSHDVDFFECAPSWSPDGSYLTLAYRGDIWALAANGGVRTNLTESLTDDSCPSWLPDARTP